MARLMFQESQSSALTSCRIKSGTESGIEAQSDVVDGGGVKPMKGWIFSSNSIRLSARTVVAP